MKKNAILTLILIFLMSSCSLIKKEPDPSELYTPTPTSTPTPLPEPKVMVTEVPDPTVTAEAFLKAWQEERYYDMYDLLMGMSLDANAVKVSRKTDANGDSAIYSNSR